MAAPRPQDDGEFLEKLVLGQLPVADMERLAVEYADDSRLAQLAESLLARDDTLLDSLRSHQTADDTSADQLISRLVERLRNAVAPAPASATVSVPTEEDSAAEPMPEYLEYFRIEKVLGQGGMGTVYLANDTRLGRQVALKTLKRERAANPAAKDRFLREARSAARIEHDHIIPIYYVGEADGIPFLAMPFLQGEPLDARIKRQRTDGADGANYFAQLSGESKPLPIPEAIRIAHQVALGLSVAHERGLVHRDIKPANIWLEAPSGRVKILDFGLARGQNEQTNLTASGAVIGTPAYMAPEQARGKSVEHRADLFSLGVVLYEMTTGRRPFTGGDTMAILSSLALDEPPAPRLLNAEIPAELSELIVAMLSKSPDQRPASARIVADKLTAILMQTTRPVVEALPTDSGDRRNEFNFDDATAVDVPLATPAEDRSPQRERRRPGTLVAIAIALLFLIGGSLGAYKLFFETKDGTLVVEVDGDADVRFKSGKLEVRDESGKLLYTLEPDEKNKSLPPGKYQIKVTGADGLNVNTPEFKLEKGGKTTVYVIVDSSWKPPSVAMSTKPELPPEPMGNFALEFDGKTSYVEVASLTRTQHNSYTIEAWVTPELTIGKLQPSSIIRVIGPAQAQIALLSSGQWQATMLYLTAGGVAGRNTKSPAEAKLVPGKPVHVAYVLDDVEKPHLRLYVDGKLVASEPTFGPLSKLPVIAQPLQKTLLGVGIDEANNDRLVNFFRGQLDEVRISRTPRYKENFTPKSRHENDTDTIAVYHFDEGHGDSLVDSSGNGRHGQIKGAKWVKRGGVSTDPDRRVAEWVIKSGGLVELVAGERYLGSVASGGELPAGPFQVSTIQVRAGTVVDDVALDLFTELRRLAKLFLWEQPITDPGLARFLASPAAANLIELSIFNDRIGDAGLEPLSKLRRLTHVSIVGAKFTDATLLRLRDAPLTFVDFRSELTGEGLAALKGKKLSNLRLSGSRLSDESMRHLKDTTIFDSLSLGYTGVGDAGLSHLTANADLAQLYLNECKVTGAGMDHVARFRKLINLSLFGLPIGDDDLAKLHPLMQLKDLNISRTKVTDAGLAHLEKASTLTALSVKETKVTEAAVKKLAAALPNCKIEWDKGVIEPTVSPDRRAAEWVLSVGGDAGILVDGRGHPVKRIEDLPQKAFKIYDVGISSGPDSKPITDADLANLDGTKLSSLRLRGLRMVTPDGVKRLAANPGLADIVVLDLFAAPLTDRGIAHLKSFKKLKSLDIGSTGVSDDGLQHLTELLELESLTISSTTINSEGLKYVRRLPALNYLAVNNKVNDAGLESLRGLKLRALRLEGNHGITSAGMVHVSDLPDLTFLVIDNTSVADDGLAHLKSLKRLETLFVDQTKVTDNGLEHLRDMTSLKHLILTRTKVTESAVKKLAAALPACKIEWDGPTIEPKK